jgi:hypothetical protein
MSMLRKLMKRALKAFNLTLVEDFDGDMDEDFNRLFAELEPYTMTGKVRMYALYRALHHVVQNKIPGDFVECGVWRGGSSMLAARTLMQLGDSGRKLYLYDTYRGMSEPGEADVSRDGEEARRQWSKSQKGDVNTWCYSSLEEVQKNLASTGYPRDQLVFVEGKVEDTIPDTSPEKICLLRLDTDFYESTYHELVHLYPRLSKNGILIVDDYHFWQGAKKAVDRYFQEAGIPVFLHRIDNAARLVVKSE